MRISGQRAALRWAAAAAVAAAGTLALAGCGQTLLGAAAAHLRAARCPLIRTTTLLRTPAT